jgi:MinD superfamily P-loop ATPase
MPSFDLKHCDFCGGCSAVCQKNAITVYFDTISVDPELCNNCLVCKKVCPVNAITKNG